jgi:PAS domain S-box-containing protein
MLFPEEPAERLRFLEQVVDLVAHPVFVKDREFRLVMVNRALCEMVGRARADVLGKTDFDIVPEEQARFFRLKDEEMFASGRDVVIDEESLTDARGVEHRLATTKVPMRSGDGAVTHLVGIIHDITSLKAAEAELRQKNEELARLVQERTDALARLKAVNAELEAFSYTVSHDLRSPLARIDGFGKLLVERYGHSLPPGASGLVAHVGTAAAEMRTLIDDLLAFSSVEHAPMRREPMDLAVAAAAIIAELRAAEAPRAVEFAVEGPMLAHADAGLVRILLQNLIGNAWKFTRHRAPARIVLARSGADFVVVDNGAGFEPALADRLFEPFQRLHPVADFPGTGVGLATSRRIVERHGGRIHAEGVVDGGARVQFSLGPAAELA